MGCDRKVRRALAAPLTRYDVWCAEVDAEWRRGAVRSLCSGEAEVGSGGLRCNAVKLCGGPVEDEDFRCSVVVDDLVVFVFDVGVADGDSAYDSWAGPVSAFREFRFEDFEDRLTVGLVKS